MDDTSAADLSRLRARIIELENLLRTEVQRVRAETIDQFENAPNDDKYILERDVADLRQSVARLAAENEHLRGLVASECFAGEGQICVRPRWKPARLRTNGNVGFVVMPFGPPWSGAVEQAVAKALRKNGMRCSRADQLSGDGIIADIWNSICESGAVIADLTEANPNVLYELGLADALGQEVVLLSQTTQPHSLPFDVLGRRLIHYSADCQEALDKLTDQLSRRLQHRRSSSERKGPQD